TFIEAFTYRMGAHTTSDDPTKYRSAAEEEYWRQRDPIDRMRLHLEATGQLDEHQASEIETQATELAEYVRRETKALGRPATASMFDHVYASENDLVAQDKAWFSQFEDSFAPAGGAR